MEDLKQLNTLITQVYQISNKINKDNLLEKIFGENKDLLEKVSVLEKDLHVKCRELENLKLKYDTDIGHKNNELIEKSEELKNFTKVSFISSLNKQINDKNLIIQQLENQIFKLKANNNVNTSKTWVVEEKKSDQVINQTSEQIVSEVPVIEQSNSEQPIIEEKVELVQESTEKPKKKKKEKQVIENSVVDTVTEEIVISKPVVAKIMEDQTIIKVEQEEVQESTEKPKKKKKEKQVVEEQVIEIEKELIEEPNEKPKKKKSKNTEPVVEEEHQAIEKEQQAIEKEQQAIEEEPIEEEIIKETTDKKKKKKEKQPKAFDPEDFEDVNGYELITYKKNYYLRDLETNELYSIVDNNPGEVVGLLSNSGKVKLN